MGSKSRKQLFQSWTFWGTIRYDDYLTDNYPGPGLPIKFLEVKSDDPDIDALIVAATRVLRASSVGDQNFISCLVNDDAAELRAALVSLADAFRN